ncbi:acyl-CoA carboxylase subunit epsilon [Streptomyces lutosisoli]|uniref:Acyl-CoA carboxylase subunit epsilon n=1 Tax=Streptomyces lutosisoli TaxID=2665721 RepID=A0ABW2VGP2_9ACTN
MPASSNTPNICAFRVEKGTPTQEEVAALALVLMARAGQTSHSDATPLPPVARWQVTGHQVARSWRGAPVQHRGDASRL